MMFAHNNSYNDFAIANRFMNFVNLSGFAPCQGKNEIVLLTRIRPIAYGTLPGTSATDTHRYWVSVGIILCINQLYPTTDTLTENG